METKRGPVEVRRENRQATKPPPATRHRAVMSLRQAIPLYDMRSHSSIRLEDILQSTRHAQKVMLVTTVSSDRVSRVKENPTYVELGLTFYPHDENLAPKVVKVVMPETWAPKMYVAALNKSIKRHSILSLESITINGRIYTTINELEWLFSATEEATHSNLICSSSYIRVSGGVLKEV
jgi:hypothetical protein